MKKKKLVKNIQLNGKTWEDISEQVDSLLSGYGHWEVDIKLTIEHFNEYKVFEKLTAEIPTIELIKVPSIIDRYLLEHHGWLLASISAKFSVKSEDDEVDKIIANYKQLDLFRGISSDGDRIKFVKDNKHLLDGLKPDGKNISEINFKHINTNTGEVLDEVTLTADDSKAMDVAK